MTPAPVLAMDGIRTQFGGVTVHANISLRVRAGETVGLIGGSGSGKTTLLRIMIGLTRPQAGHIQVFGRELGHMGEDTTSLRRRWGVLFQHGALFSALTVFDNVAFPLRELRLLDEALIADVVAWRLQSVGLGAAASYLPAELSGGMVKRAALARALALEPELLFLDEPTAGLDPSTARGFVRLIRSLRERLQLTIVMASHDSQTLTALCDRIVVLAEGRIVADAPPATLRQMTHPFVQEFFGPSDAEVHP